MDRDLLIIMHADPKRIILKLQLVDVNGSRDLSQILVHSLFKKSQLTNYDLHSLCLIIVNNIIIIT